MIRRVGDPKERSSPGEASAGSGPIRCRGRSSRKSSAAAVQAPNHHLTQPWRFVVLNGAARGGRRGPRGAVRRKRPDCVTTSSHARPPAGAGPRGHRVPLDRGRRRSGHRPRGPRCGRPAIQNLLLAAHARGLATMWRAPARSSMSGGAGEPGLGPADAIVGFSTSASADVAPPPRQRRRPVGEVVRVARRMSPLSAFEPTRALAGLAGMAPGSGGDSSPAATAWRAGGLIPRAAADEAARASGRRATRDETSRPAPISLCANRRPIRISAPPIRLRRTADLRPGRSRRRSGRCRVASP